MKLTKKLEAEILQAYNECWKAYLEGDLRTHASFLSDQFKFIGTSEGEQFKNKKDWISYCKKTIKQFAGVIQKKTRNLKVLPLGEEAMVVENADLYVLIDSTWTYYSEMRISAVLQKEKAGWKYIHQHGSLPDTRANDGEVIATEQIKKENLQLREAVKRRTAELENNNRELEIESALERVRAVAMGMSKAEDMLDICRIISKELENLSINEIRNIQTAIIDEAKGIYLNYEYFRLKKKAVVTSVEYNKQKDVAAFARKILKGPDSFFTKTFKGDEIKNWMNYQAKAGQWVDPHLKKIESVHYYFYSIGQGALGISTYAPLAKEAISLFKRFRNVFQLAYQRFADIQKAEARAREAQVEAALEKVRSRSLAMHNSEEVKGVAGEVFDRLRELGFGMDYGAAIILIFQQDSKDHTQWIADPAQAYPQPFRIPFSDHAMVTNLFKARKKGLDFFASLFPYHEKKEYFSFLFQQEDFRQIPDKVKKLILESKNYGYSVAFEKNSAIMIPTNKGKLVSDDQREILKRFAKVFEQSYTRFLDLKTAEAQAKEARIEAALEKVRAQAMAMHKPDELLKVCEVMYKELRALGFDEIRNAMIHTFDKKDQFFLDYDFSGTAGGKISKIPTKGFPIIEYYLKEIKKSVDTFLEIVFTGEELKSWKNTRKATGQLEDPRMKSLKALYYYYYSIGAGDIGISTFSSISKEKMEILQRFRNVFQLSYQRYHDIEQAEAQAREAQIEAALEKVRSASLSMHHSDELEKVVEVLFHRLSELGLDFDGALIFVFDKEERNARLWVFSTLLPTPVKVDLPYDKEISENAIVRDLWDAIEKGGQLINKTYSGKEKNDYFRYVGKHNHSQNFPEDIKKLQLNAPSYTTSIVAGKNSVVGFDSWSGQSTSDEDFQVLKRFAKVFEQSYTRFLDLKTAEAQARESQIQLGLERLRARTMAMHHSSELADVATVMFQQVKALGIPQWVCGFSIFEMNDNECTWYPGSPDGDILQPCKIPLTEHPVFISYKESKKRGDELYVYEKKGEYQEEHYNYMMSLPGMRESLQRLLDAGLSFPTFQIDHIANFSHGNLVFITYEHFPEMHDVFKRFAKVFEQTYTRFLDLQKAEAQAREGQIQLALERVRARTMAMQRSDELADAATVLFQQVKALGVHQWACGFGIFEIDDKEFTWYQGREDGNILPPCKIPLTEHPVFIQFNESRKRGDELYVYEKTGELQTDHYRYMCSLPVLGKLMQDRLDAGEQFPTFQIDHIANFSHGNLVFITYEPVPEMHDVFKRFAKVFDQTYTRFLDLQTAEAQAREGQIQLALERVRARTMAMQRSNELPEAAKLLFQQVQSLGAPSWTAGYCIWDEDKKAITLSMSSIMGDIYPSWRAPLDENPTFIHYLEAHNKGLELYIEEESGEVTERNYQYLLTLPVVGEELALIKKEGHSFPTYQVDHCAYFSKGFLLFITYQPVPELHDVFKRFASVFDQTYTRFLDLQKVEAQAREGQIQLALERVRARTMAMQRSDELREVVSTLYEQLNNLQFDSNACNIIIIDKESNNQRYWVSGFTQKLYPESYNVPYFKHPYIDDQLQSWKEGRNYIVIEYSGKMKYEFDKQFFSQTDFKNIPVEVQKIISALPSAKLSTAFFTYGALQIIGPHPLSEENAAVLQRFAKVFDQTYTRFLDLQKAEAQAREAQIETALERVRSRTMAMHRSEEIAEIVGKIFGELSQLDLVLNRVLIWIFHNEEKYIAWWSANPEAAGNAESYRIDYNDQQVFLTYLQAWQKRIPLHQYTLSGETKKNWEDYLFSNTGLAKLPMAVQKGMREEGTIFTTSTISDYGLMMVGSFEPLSERNIDIIQRFGRVFQQSYTRYLDVQKAEAQAREAKIEAALEKVRSRSLAMHKSDELQDVVHTVIERLKELNVELYTAIIIIFSENSKDIHWWLENTEHQQHPRILLKYAKVPYLQDLLEAKESGKELFFKCYTGKEKNELYHYLFDRTDLRNVPRGQKEFLLGNEFATIAIAFAKKTGIHITSYSKKNFSEEETGILKRFAKVFDQSYTRFLDLQKAEAQAREANIEASLERVRAKAMAMHKSEDLKTAVATVFEELDKLNMGLIRCGIAILDKEKPRGDIWITIKSEEGNVLEVSGDEPLDIHPLLKGAYDAWRKSEDYSYELKGQDLVDYYESITQTKFQEPISSTFSRKEQPQYYYNAVFRDGSLFAFLDTPFNNETRIVMKRFANVFDLTYKRFLDLQKAEAQAREATIETSLERVRAKAMAMHQSQDLVETIRTFYQQLDALQLMPRRCGVGLIDKETRIAELTGMVIGDDGETREIIGPLKLQDHPVLIDVYENWLQQKEYQPVLRGNEIKEYYQRVGSQISIQNYPEDAVQYGYFFSFREGAVYAWNEDPFTEDELKIYRRFTAVLSLTYKRYKDLKLAEAQAREARIEASLEKVRSRSLAMHKSDELLDVIMVVSEQLEQLGFQFDNVSFGANNEDFDINFWMAVRDHPRPLQIHAPYFDNPVINRIRDAIRNHSDFFADHLNQAENAQWISHLTEKAGRKFSDEIRSYLTGPHGYSRSTVVLKHIFLFIGNYLGNSYTDEENAIFKRFANVFDQSYTRFLDLQKAEAQAKEAQVEVGLERVRAMTMAMHNSEDVSQATATMLTELEKLDIQNYRGGILNIRENETMEVWSINTLDDGSIVRAIGDFDMKIHPFWQQLYKGWKNKDDYAYFLMAGKDKEDYIRILDARRDYLPNGLQHLPDSHVQSYFFDEGAVWTFSPEPHNEENKQVMKRFAAVFSLTFRRYQDLKNAEAQAREARIEASLEKVRSKAMAMHNSQDLADTIGVFYKELQSFSLTPRRCGVGLLDKEDRIGEMFTWNTTESGESLELVGRLKMEGHPVLENVYQHWITQTEYHPVLRGNEIKEYYQVIRPQISFPHYSNDIVQFGYFFFFREGGVYAWTEKEMSEDELQIYRRFTSVLSLTYKRYNDLRIAEANAREARIEAAMEKVRARAMAMQKPDELVDVAQLLRKEMGLLGVEELEGSAIFIHNEATGETECWYAIKDDRREKLGADHITMDLNDTWVGRQMLQFYHSDNKQISIPMLGDHRKEWIHYFSERSSAMAEFYSETVPDRIYHLFKFSNGFMGATSPGEISAESWGLLQRATTVFSLAYTRFSDLQHAEANAKEAVKQAALDRVRAEIASMRTVGDLERITPLIWNELTILGIPFIRCGVFIMDEAQQTIHTFLSNPEGKAIAAFHLPYNTPGNLGLVLNHWHDKKIYVDHWNESSFIELAKVLMQQGSIVSEDQYLSSLPHGGFYLHFLPFLQGMLYVGNTTQLGNDDIKLIQHVADAFSTAYARYEDFNRLEAAKVQVEQTLTDLKQAQTQLVQSEKMASLGELTAGIAHEIQNPLNFVNNFSDVSNELLQEMKSELEKGNAQDALALAEDVKQNLEKILHHGKRADAIVKGMLQHSRTSSGQKELTDINLLADEYLRLAFHGLRAKDKSFNARFETDFDSKLDKINVVPQEIGRVILNLINNAFYAVNEKKKLLADSGNAYEPIVTVSTKQANGKISISVTDNGIGIPQKSLDKIFQPFFTTKPTSQGTGLGLSLAYDIVTKGHGGELKVETKEGEGSVFIVSLPG